jgi:TonB-linked SusC/RagA family outer membrane protein
MKTGFLGLLLAGFISLPVYAQQVIRINGSVSDNFGEPVSAVSVTVKGAPTQGAMTDEKGEYSLSVPSDTTTLIFSSVGYETQEVKVGKRRVIAIILKEEAQTLGDVTIVAFGTQKKESVIASVETVKISDLKQPASNLTSAFAGKIPGIISYQTTGEPGADNAQFFVRGITTFGVKVEPLILIDGFEATSDDLARMQPDDIESFSILKDASATVLYGARGANGIIAVSTKSGREGPAKISARVDTHVAVPTKIPEFIGGVEYMRLYNEAQISRDPIQSAYYDEQKIYATEQGENPMIYPNVDWYDILFNRYTINTKVNLNISGGGQVATYYVAGGYDNETGLLKIDGKNNFNNNINIDRFHIRSNVSIKVGKSTTLDTRIQGRFEKYTGPYTSASSIFNMVMDSNPVDFPAVYEPDAANRYTEHILFGSAFLNTGTKSNPYAEMVKGYETRDETTITAQATLIQDLKSITKGLKFQAKVSANVWSKYSSRRTYNPYYYSIDTYNQITEEYKLFNLNPTSGQAYLGDVNPGRDASGHYYFEARLNWDRKFGKHSVGVMTVGMAEENLLTAGNSRSIFETLPERNLGNSGRVTYDYDSRYFFEFCYGYNGSEKFTGEKKYGFFPSLGGGWLVSNETFWNSMKETISLLKLKFTWGMVGNDAISDRAGRFWFLSDVNMSGGAYMWGEAFQTVYNGYSIGRYANPDITWEVSEKYNLGLELGLLKDEQLKFQVDFFRDYRNKIYWPRENFPATAGLEASISGNVGKVQAQGIDASIDYQQFFSKSFWMTGRVNMTYAVNKIIERDEKNYADEYLKKVGQNINQPTGLIAERLFVDEPEITNSPKQDFSEYMAGDIKYTDVNNDGVVNANDYVAMGYPTVPEIQYGFGISAGYKKIDFSFFFQGNARVSFFINSGDIAPFLNRRNALAIISKDSWSETSPDVHAFWPRLSTESLANNTRNSSWWLQDGSFLRLKSVEIGYNLPEIKKLRLHNGRVYLSMENLFVLSSFKLWDPELRGSGLGYPLNRRFNVGIQVSF